MFRIAFGSLLFISQIRFVLKGWVKQMYLDPAFHFTFPGFHWVRPLPEAWMYALVFFAALMALFIALGLFYRYNTILFFLSFTYLELIDKTWYLNHYYFVSVVAFMLIFLPANQSYSLDAMIWPARRLGEVAKWQVECLKWQLALVYFFAGLAKVKYDWLILAQPLKIWLSARTDLPFIGSLLDEPVVHFLFAWSGMLYDLSIPFFLFNKKTRPYAYIAVIVFHVLTWVLFNIGMFPWIMIFSALIFFPASEWQRIFGVFGVKLRLSPTGSSYKSAFKYKWVFIAIFFAIQVCIPLRHYFYKGDVLWTEKGFRFAWHVMLMEKNGMCQYIVKDKVTGKQWTVHPSEYLTFIQEKQMSFQPDMIWQFAKFLQRDFSKRGFDHVEIRVRNLVSLNGRKSRPLIDPDVDLTRFSSESEAVSAILLY